uniref:Putative secreted protein n=1 Tax=Ixodes ricinus TaxID=34613 RepID=A0A147BD02_IXORI
MFEATLRCGVLSSSCFYVCMFLLFFSRLFCFTFVGSRQPPLIDNRTPAPEDLCSVTSVARTAPLKFGARVPPPSGPILKTLAVSAAGASWDPPPGQRRRPRACTCCGRAGRELQRETAHDGRREAPACLVRSDGGNNEESWDDGRWKETLARGTGHDRRSRWCRPRRRFGRRPGDMVRT